MTVATADLHKAINTAWDASGLNALFQAYWTAAEMARFVVLNDQEAAAGQPYPYCVVGQSSSVNISRMSGGVNTLRVVRDVTLRFDIYAGQETGKTAKEVAAELGEELIKVFGGHPTVAATGAIILTNGKHLITQYQNDFGIRIDDNEYQWVVEYLFRIDVPVAV